MEQLSFFKPPYRYIIDSSAIMAQKPNDAFPRIVHKSLWAMVDKNVEEKIIVTCSEIEEEVEKDDVVGDWLRITQCVVLPIDDTVQRYVRKIVTEHPKLIDFHERRGSSSGDAFLIATAMKYELNIITQENKEKQNKIPQICKSYGIQTMSITDLCIEEGWKF